MIQIRPVSDLRNKEAKMTLMKYTKNFEYMCFLKGKEKLKCTLNFEVSEPEENEYYVAGISTLKNILHELHCKNYAKIETMIHKTSHCKTSELGEFLKNYFSEILEEYELNEIDEYSVYNEIVEDIDMDSCTIEYQMTADSGEEIGNWMILEIEGDNKKISLEFEEDE